MPECIVSDSELVRAAESLPSAPRLLWELGQLVQNPRTGADEVVHLLRRDQGLVARIVRLANSAAYSPSERIGSIDGAVAYVGFAEVHRLVGTVVATQFGELKLQRYLIAGERLRLHSLFTAVMMEEMAKYARENPRRCYTVGLLRTVGIMTLDRVPSASELPFVAGGGAPLDLWEQHTWGITNPEAAERILLQWGLPHESVTAIRHHYRSEGKQNPITHLLALAASAAADRNIGIPGEEIYFKLTSDNFAKAGLDLRSFQAAGEKAQRKFEQLKSLLT